MLFRLVAAAASLMMTQAALAQAGPPLPPPRPVAPLPVHAREAPPIAPPGAPPEPGNDAEGRQVSSTTPSLGGGTSFSRAADKGALSVIGRERPDHRQFRDAYPITKT